MISLTHKKFWEYFHALSPELQQDAEKAFSTFQRDPFYPGLNFEKIKNSAYCSVRIGIHYRAIGKMTSRDTIEWTWIGTHAEYDKIISGKR